MPKEQIKEIQGQDRTFGGDQLFIDLIPRSCWLTSIRTSIVKSDWDRLRKFVYSRAANKCECCRSQQKLQAHQRWLFDEQKQLQKLMRIVALCKKCHFSTHMGRAKCIGLEDQAKQHLMKVRNWDLTQLNKHEEESWALWRQRNKKKWKLDIQIILKNNLKLNKKCEQLLSKQQITEKVQKNLRKETKQQKLF